MKVKIGLWCFVLLSLVSCSYQSKKEDWYLKGGDVHLVLDWPEKRILMEDSSGMIFSGVILSTKPKEDMLTFHCRLDNINPAFNNIYTEDSRSDFLIWIKYIGKDDANIMMNEVSSHPYFFNRHPSVNIFEPYKQGRYLSQEEGNMFLQSSNYYNVLSRYAVNVIMNPDSTLKQENIQKMEARPVRRWMKTKYKVSMDITQISDYLQDNDPSTSYISDIPTTNTQLEYILNNKKTDIPTPLDQPIPIRAVLIRTGNLDNLSEFRKYRRPRQLTIYFSQQYIGGLGHTKGNYNESNITIPLSDEATTHFIIFYEPINAKIFCVKTDSYYLGEENEMQISDMVFFGDNNT